MNPFTKPLVAAGTLTHRRLVAFTANDGEGAQASAATDLLAGVLDCPGGATVGQRIDVIMFGPADVEYGGTVAPGAPITSDGSGKAVAAAPAEGVMNTIAGYPLTNAVSGDIAKTFISISRLTGEA